MYMTFPRHANLTRVVFTIVVMSLLCLVKAAVESDSLYESLFNSVNPKLDDNYEQQVNLTVSDSPNVTLTFDKEKLIAGDVTNMTFTFTGFTQGASTFIVYPPRTFSFKDTKCINGDGQTVDFEFTFPTLLMYPTKLADLKVICSTVSVGESETFGAYTYYVYLSYIMIKTNDSIVYTGSVPLRVWPIESYDKKALFNLMPFQPYNDLSNISSLSFIIPPTTFDFQKGDVFRLGAYDIAAFMPSDQELTEACRLQFVQNNDVQVYRGSVTTDKVYRTVDFSFDVQIPKNLVSRLIICDPIFLSFPDMLNEKIESGLKTTPSTHSFAQLNYQSLQADWGYDLHPLYKDKLAYQFRRVHPSLGEYNVELFSAEVPPYQSPEAYQEVKPFLTFTLRETTTKKVEERTVYTSTGTFRFQVSQAKVIQTKEQFSLSFFGVNISNISFVNVYYDSEQLQPELYEAKFDSQTQKLSVIYLGNENHTDSAGKVVSIEMNLMEFEKDSSSIETPFVTLSCSTLVFKQQRIVPFPTRFGINDKSVIRADIIRPPGYTLGFIPFKSQIIDEIIEELKGRFTQFNEGFVCDTFVQAPTDYAIYTNKQNTIDGEYLANPIVSIRCYYSDLLVDYALIDFVNTQIDEATLIFSLIAGSGMKFAPIVAGIPNECFNSTNPPCSSECINQCAAHMSCKNDLDCASLSCATMFVGEKKLDYKPFCASSM